MAKNIHVMPNHHFSKVFIENIIKNKISNNIFFVDFRRINGIDSELNESSSFDGVQIYYYNNNLVDMLCKHTVKGDSIYFHRLNAQVDEAINKLSDLFSNIGWIYWGEVDFYSRFKEREIFYSTKTIKYIKSNEFGNASYLKRIMLLTRMFHIREYFRSLYYLRKRISAIKRINFFYHWSEVDYIFLKNVYNINDREFPEFRFFCYKAFYSPKMKSNIKHEDHFENKTYNIMLGHSSNFSVNHIDGLLLIKKQIDIYPINFKVYSPLVYGDIKYREYVISQAKNIIGDAFVPVAERMKPDEYSRFLSKIDLAIFPIRHSAAAGNIFELLCMGKIVFIHELSVLYQFLISKNIVVYPLSFLSCNSIISIIKKHEKIKDENIAIAIKLFGSECVDKSYANNF